MLVAVIPLKTRADLISFGFMRYTCRLQMVIMSTGKDANVEAVLQRIKDLKGFKEWNHLRKGAHQRSAANDRHRAHAARRLEKNQQVAGEGLKLF